MPCLINCTKKGQYCCDAGKDGKLAGFTVNNDPLILKAANLPPTPILCQVDKEWAPTGMTIGGDVTCVVIRKPGCYKVDIDCADYEGDAPQPGATELCYTCDPSFDSMAALAEAIAGVVPPAPGEPPTVIVDVSAITDKLCEIFGVPVEGEPTILDKLCEMATSLEALLALFNGGLDVNVDFGAVLTALAALQTCMNQIKANTAAITGIETSLGQVGCVKDEDGNITGSVLVCKVSDTTTSPPTDTIKVWLFNTNGTTVENYDGPYEGCTSLSELSDLLEAILKCPKPVSMECVQKFTRCVGYDNGRTPGSSTNDGGVASDLVHKNSDYIVKGWSVNGAEVGAGDIIPAGGAGGAGWTAQLNSWAAFFNANMPAGAKCQADFGFLPAPTWRYAKITCNDPNTTFGPLRMTDERGICFTVYPILESLSVEQRYRYSTVDCDGVKATVWCNAAGETVPAPEDPECWYPCDVTPADMVEGVVPDCGLPKIQKVCDKTADGETEFYRMEYDCDGETVIAYFTVESWDAGNPEEYVPQGAIVDCLTGEPLKAEGIVWELCYGYYVDAEGNNQETVWTIGVDACGNILFPNGSKCPIYLQGGTGGDAELPQCSCTGSCSARALVGFGSVKYTTTGAGGQVHGIQFDAAANQGLENVLANTVTNPNSSEWSICTVSPAPGVSFTYSQGTLVRNGPGDYTSTAPTPQNNCQLELLSQEWNRHEDGTAEGTTGYSIRCCGTKENNCVVPGEGDNKECLAILDPQPTNVIKGPVPEKSELLCLKDIKLQNEQIIENQLETLQKYCDGLVDCEVCVTLTVPEGAVVSSFDVTGQEEVIEPAATSVAELMLALQQKGYSISTVQNNTLTVCGAKLISAIKLDNGTLVLATPAPAKKGQLVCDPNTRALLASSQNIEGLLQTNNSLLADLVKCLCGPKEEDQCNPNFNILSGEGAGPYVPFGDAGPEQNWPFGTPNDSAIYGGPGFQVQAPYPECAKGPIRIKLALDHETSGGLYNSGTGIHNGFFLTPSAGSWVTGSGTNGIVVNSATSALVKQDGASPFGTDRSVRCLELDTTAAELAAGITFNFGAFGSITVGGEYLHGVEVSVVNDAELDCSACTAEERAIK